jgi:hypothetical protein
MSTRRAALLGMVAGMAASAILPRGVRAFSFEDLPADAAAAFDAACGPATDHAGLIAAARQDLLARIAKGLSPAGASEQVGCPTCGCSFTVTADGAL